MYSDIIEDFGLVKRPEASITSPVVNVKLTAHVSHFLFKVQIL